MVNVELHGCFLFFICVKTIAYVHPNLNPCSAAVRKSGSKMQHVTIGACALSARTYNAEVQGSDARLRNHFVFIMLESTRTSIAVASVTIGISTWTPMSSLYFKGYVQKRSVTACRFSSLGIDSGRTFDTTRRDTLSSASRNCKLFDHYSPPRSLG